MKPEELVAVSTFRSTADAQIAKGILDEAGIESLIRSDNLAACIPRWLEQKYWFTPKMR